MFTINCLIRFVAYTWSNRQNEWYNSERRFIFTCKSEAERKRWMTAIRNAAATRKQEMKEEAKTIWEMKRKETLREQERMQ
jgi:hypothetical protein